MLSQKKQKLYTHTHTHTHTPAAWAALPLSYREMGSGACPSSPWPFEWRRRTEARRSEGVCQGGCWWSEKRWGARAGGYKSVCRVLRPVEAVEVERMVTHSPPTPPPTQRLTLVLILQGYVICFL